MSDADGGVDDLEDLPPSAKYVYRTLEYEGPLTQSELADETLLPMSTVRKALRALEDIDAIEHERPSDDLRRKRYRTVK